MSSTVFCGKHWVDSHINAGGHSVFASLSDVRTRQVARISWPRYNDHSIRGGALDTSGISSGVYLCSSRMSFISLKQARRKKKKNETFTTHTSFCAMYGKAKVLPTFNCALRHEGMRKMGGIDPCILSLGT